MREHQHWYVGFLVLVYPEWVLEREWVRAGGCTDIGGCTETYFLSCSGCDPQEFVLHTPDFEASKCWVGNLGQAATHTVIYAQLYTPDGICHGLHTFVAPIRDPVTMKPYPGILVGDMGEKIGINGVANG